MSPLAFSQLNLTFIMAAVMLATMSAIVGWLSRNRLGLQVSEMATGHGEASDRDKAITEVHRLGSSIVLSGVLIAIGEIVAGAAEMGDSAAWAILIVGSLIPLPAIVRMMIALSSMEGPRPVA